MASDDQLVETLKRVAVELQETRQRLRQLERLLVHLCKSRPAGRYL